LESAKHFLEWRVNRCVAALMRRMLYETRDVHFALLLACLGKIIRGLHSQPHVGAAAKDHFKAQYHHPGREGAVSYRDSKLFSARRLADAFENVYAHTTNGLTLVTHKPLPADQQ
jgi:hypothetical protein